MNRLFYIAVAMTVLVCPVSGGGFSFTPGPHSIRVPSVTGRGRLDLTRMKPARLYLSQSSRHPRRIIGRASGPARSVCNDSGRRRVFIRANVGSATGMPGIWVRSRYTVYRRGGFALWMLSARS